MIALSAMLRRYCYVSMDGRRARGWSPPHPPVYAPTGITSARPESLYAASNWLEF